MQLSKEASTWRVLVIDDEPDNLKLAADLLEFLGATVVQSRGGQGVFDLVKDLAPNFMLLDLAMPGIDGWMIQKQLRANPEFDNMPIVALTALAMPADAEKIRAAGFDGYITKPFRVQKLITELAACIESFSARKTNLVVIGPEQKHD
jgi:two-component system, cell cycle response regulator DivK